VRDRTHERGGGDRPRTPRRSPPGDCSA
jgi:hypothetical protein